MDPSKGHRIVTEFRHISNASAMLAVYKFETALENEHKTKWRNYGAAATQAWHARQRIYRFIKKTISGVSGAETSDDTAIAELERLISSPKGKPLGDSAAPNWAGINQSLADTPFEQTRAKEKQERAAENKKRKAENQAKQAQGMQGPQDVQGPPVRFKPGGIEQYGDGEGPELMETDEFSLGGT